MRMSIERVLGAKKNAQLFSCCSRVRNDCALIQTPSKSLSCLFAERPANTYLAAAGEMLVSNYKSHRDAAATFGTLESAYRLDVRERTNLYESYYVDRTHSALRFLVADAAADAAVILAFLVDIVAPSSALLAASGLQPATGERAETASLQVRVDRRSAACLRRVFAAGSTKVASCSRPSASRSSLWRLAVLSSQAAPLQRVRMQIPAAKMKTRL